MRKAPLLLVIPVAIAAFVLPGNDAPVQVQASTTVQSDLLPKRILPRIVASPSVKPTPRSTPRAARKSRSSSAAALWANTWAARTVAKCESGGDPTAVNPSGKYRGKWQMDADFWRTYGGLRFASTPDRATEAEQDIVAYKGYLARGWQPWECRKKL